MDPPTVMAYYIDGDLPLLSRRPQYPATLCKLQYLAEGGANIVYQISILNESTQIPSKLDRKLLRLRKNVRHSQPATEQLRAFDDYFKPMFDSKHLVKHDLVRLDDGIVSALNDLLRKRIRPSHRAHDYLPVDEIHGMLITDMTPRIGEHLVSLKPKWLLQSPSAPPTSKRCRTCALRAQRRAMNRATAADDLNACPLDLVSTAVLERRKAALHITDDRRIAHFVADEIQDDVLGLLKDYQQRLDPTGVLSVRDPQDILNLCKAMTIRDCTLYIKRSRTGIEARLGDLDFKAPEKLGLWKKTETSLIDDGWYTNDEAQSVHTQEMTCLLSREQLT